MGDFHQQQTLPWLALLAAYYCVEASLTKWFSRLCSLRSAAASTDLMVNQLFASTYSGELGIVRRCSKDSALLRKRVRSNWAHTAFFSKQRFLWLKSVGLVWVLESSVLQAWWGWPLFEWVVPRLATLCLLETSWNQTSGSAERFWPWRNGYLGWSPLRRCCHWLVAVSARGA